MNKKIQLGTCTLIVLLAALCLGSLNQTQAGITIASTKKVSLKITFSDGEWIQAGAIEGGIIRIERSGQGFAFSPFVRDVNKGLVEIVVSKITRQNETDSLEEIARLTVSSKSGSATMVNPSLSIQLLGIDKGADGASNDGLRFQSAKYCAVRGSSAMRQDHCCVTCGSTTACSICVTMSCGSCCTQVCCP
jgi:hypothetical protein